MKDINEVRCHLAEAVYTNKARTAIYYWLLGKGIINHDKMLVFKGHDLKDEMLTSEGLSFEDFVSWFDSEYVKLAGNVYFRTCDGVNKVNFKICDINIGDYVKVMDSDNPRSEYVEAIASLNDQTLIVCLSDGTWVKSSNVVPYTVQGDERTAMIDKLNQTKR